ncbi:hypothetical protein [Streptacidiphilus sp. MAP5-3]|uniref:hypothetical protein n=1 Tax=unclassified Streptacidiphilus TaxID=2643834 RepID=UPI00351920F7
MGADLFTITPTCTGQATHVRNLLRIAVKGTTDPDDSFAEHHTNAQAMLRAGDITDHGRWTLTAAQLGTLALMVAIERAWRTLAEVDTVHVPACLAAIEKEITDVHQAARQGEDAHG